MIRPPRNPRTIRMLNMLESLYLDSAVPVPERLCAMALTAQVLGIPVNILVPSPSAWRNGLARLRFKVDREARELGKRPKKGGKNRNVAKALAEIRKLQNEGKA